MATYQCATETTAAANTIEGVATPSLSRDGTSRITWGTDEFGRGVSVTVSPLQATGQFVCHSVVLTLVTSNAGPEEG